MRITFLHDLLLLSMSLTTTVVYKTSRAQRFLGRPYWADTNNGRLDKIDQTYFLE